ncbi:BrnA antitoxin family protein [Candidatus Uhrbacteria bacterium]|nr:BrnA antitoxin family protein [Candidatus Uhrbacteria bacterium]
MALKKRPNKRNIRQNIKCLPFFRTEDEERDFWATHELSDIFDVSKSVEALFPNLKPSTKTITIRVPESMLFALKGIAHKKDVPYQSLAKVYLDEKIREEYNERALR